MAHLKQFGLAWLAVCIMGAALIFSFLPQPAYGALEASSEPSKPEMPWIKIPDEKCADRTIAINSAVVLFGVQFSSVLIYHNEVAVSHYFSEESNKELQVRWRGEPYRCADAYRVIKRG
jgi:hypothetical protein